MKWLIHKEGSRIVRQISLKESKYMLGRGIKNDIIFETPKVSRTHAVLVKEGEAYYVIDQDSANHVFVNSVQVKRKKLTSGDTINLSDEVTLLYLSEQDFNEQITALLNHMWNAVNKENFLRLKEVTSRIISLDTLEHILHIVLKEVVKLVSAERGFITLTDEKGNIQKNTPIVHNIPLEQTDAWESIVSHSTVQQVIHTREPVFILRSGGDEPQDFSHSIIALKLQSVMCAPLLFGKKLVGVLYVDSGYQPSDFSEGDRFFFTILSDHAAIAIENAKLYRMVLESVPDPVMVYDLEGRITYLNPAFILVFGWTLENTMKQTSDFVPVEKLAEARRIVDEINHGKTVSGIETCRLTKEKTMIDVSISGAGFFDNSGQLQGYVLTFQNISERKKAEREIKFLAYHDVLTRLPNRKSFYIHLEDELVRSDAWTGADHRVKGHKRALLFLDVDKFKHVNDTLGHDAGDELLKLIAVRLQYCLRKSDYVFRLGGDEFTIILVDLTDNTAVARVAEKIREEIAESCCIKGHELYVTVSIGISIYPDDGDEVETLVKNADMAMYAAKEKGQGYCFFTEEMNRKALERMMLESSLRNALQCNQLVIHYQPLVSEKHQIIGMEALLRWHHPELGLVNPSKFIPLAEETGAIIPIGKWVLHTACKQARKWHEMDHKGIYVAVNLSPRQFKEPDLVETVEQVLEDTGLSPDCLKLEVTESGIMENPEQAITTMKILRAKGIHFSIDDFGTGYSSLSYLKRFPIDTLKIDRSFVIECITNKDDQEIIKTIISMAQNLGIDTIAEGVENKEQLDFLVRHGCCMMQGYYFGRPMPADKFEEILQTRGTVSD